MKKCPARQGVPPPQCVGNTAGQVLFFSSTGLPAWFLISFLVSSKFIIYFLLGLISSRSHLLSLHPCFCLMCFSTSFNFCLFFSFSFVCFVYCLSLVPQEIDMYLVMKPFAIQSLPLEEGQ